MYWKSSLRSGRRSELVAAVRIETLDSRVLMCAVPDVPQPLGTVVAWHSAPIDAVAVVGETSSDTGSTPSRNTTGVAPIRINVGGGTYVDPSGTTWSPDTGATGGTTDSAWVFPVAGTTSDPLYYVRRYGSFSYTLPVAAAGSYEVKLHFTDPKYGTAGQRVFSVQAEGQAALSNIDIAASVGKQTAMVRTFVTQVSDGKLNLSFVKQVENPILSAIEVLPYGPPTSPPPTSPPPTSPPPTSPPPTSPPPTSPPPTSPPVGSFTQINYTTKAPSPIARAEALTAKYNNRLYVFGGFNQSNGPVVRSDYYDPATNTWTRIRDLPQRLTHVGLAQNAENAYFVGGYVGTGPGYQQAFGSKKVWAYHFASNSYYALPDLPASYAGGGAAVVGRNLHYFGGQNASRGDITVHLVLNLDNPSAGWQSRAAIPHGRSHMGAVELNGKIYTVAGQTGNDQGMTALRWLEIYNPATNTWSQGAQLPAAVSHITSSTFTMDGRIIVMGGEWAHNAQLRTVYAYNPSTNSWTTLSPLPAARFSGVANVINGKIIFTTGGSSTVTWQGTPA